MTIKIIQICDGCNKSRELQAEGVTGPREIRSVEQDNGWCAVHNHKHLCPDCIKNALNN